MATVGEVKAVLAEAAMKAGESWGALDTSKGHTLRMLNYLDEAIEQINFTWSALNEAKTQVAPGIETAQEAAQLAGAAFDGSGHELALQAVSQFNRAEAEARVAYQMLEEHSSEILSAGGMLNRIMAEIRLIHDKIGEEAQDALMAGQFACETFIGSLG